jgi:hypothetical protein
MYAAQDNHDWSMAQASAKRALALAYLENREQARLELHDVLTKTRSWGEDELSLIALLVEPVCLIHEGKFEQAVELAAFISNYPVSWNETKKQAQAMLESAARNLPEEAVLAAIQSGQGLKLDAVIAAILD